MSNSLPDEFLLLLGQESTPVPLDAASGGLASLLMQADYKSLLNSTIARELFATNSAEEVEIRILKEHQGGVFTERALQILCVANACLCAFVQNAWTGPSVDLDPAVLLPASENISNAALTLMAADNEEVYHLTPKLLFLCLSKLLYRALREHEGIELQTLSWWNFRSLLFQQRILENPSATVLSDIEKEIALVSKALEPFVECTNDDDGRVALLTRFYLEKGVAHHLHRQDKRALESFMEAQRTSGFTWQLTGALGKRTKFQQNDVSQLVISAKSSLSDQGNGEPASKMRLPENLKLNDDTLLENVEFSQASFGEEFRGMLKVSDQCILLSLCLNVKNTNPKDGLTNEEMLPFVRRVLDQPANWSVYTVALLLRSRLESEKSRTVERAALQLQALVDQFDVSDGPPAERMQWIWALDMPSKWELERELADRFLSLGVTSSALDIFTRLELWEQCVECLRILDKTAKAESLLRQLIEKSPRSPKYWCLLGDFTKDASMYEKAWNLSNHRYARAMRSLGAHHFRAKDYVRSAESYKAALAINPLFESSWFMLGCAAMQLSDWQLGVQAFSKVTTINWENAEAWNNLASVFINLKKKPEAHRALQQALKINYDSWKMWQNYLYVSVDIADFEEAVRSMHRLIDLRVQSVGAEAVDFEVLEIIIRSVLSGTADADGRSARLLSKQVDALLHAITERISDNVRVWLLGAQFWEGQEKWDVALEARLRAYRAVSKNPDITHSHDAFDQVANVTLDLIDAYERLGPKPLPRESDVSISGDASKQVVCEDWRYQSKMVLRTVIGRTVKAWDGTEQFSNLRHKLDNLK
ncbi:hypothetical protein HDU93_001526 [Gonapodya sp. JEL0774]|nr:hypothetical protein HDU93_001526 [Gonapodya sp. JEL0774]